MINYNKVMVWYFMSKWSGPQLKYILWW